MSDNENQTNNIILSEQPRLLTNKELRSEARKQLKGNWGNAILASFLMSLIVFVSAFTGIGPIILVGPMIVGLSMFYKKLSEGESVKAEMVFRGFNNFGSNFVLGLLQGLFIFLWALLFLIPAYIKMCSYAMAPFILIDNKEIGGLEAITKSRKMMNGYKMKLFLLRLSFIGWMLLSMLTLGIGMLWLVPYMHAADANFYKNLKEIQPEQEVQ